MEEMNCSVIYDLLPLYIEGMCSDETRLMVKEHLENCKECRSSLEYMKKNIEIPEEKDTALIKKVKSRILIEKLVVAIAAVFVAVSILFFGGLYLMSDQVAMNDMLSEDNVRVEQDANGDVWLVRRGNAIEASHVIPDLYTVDGEIICETESGGFKRSADGEQLVLKVVLYESRLSRLSQQILGESSSIEEEKSLLFNMEEKSNYQKVIFSYDEGEKVLWERN